MLGRLFGLVLALVGLAALVAVGGYFALKRADIPYETLATHYESGASRYVDLPGGVRMHYRDQGAGPTLLLIHGFSASLHTWEPWVEQLGDDYRIVTLDLPGHGLTSAPAGYQPSMQGYAAIVEEFAQALDIARFAIGGNSMGGHVAWEYALAHPERVDALILVDSAGWPDTRSDPENAPLVFRLLANPLAASLLRDLDTTRLTRDALVSSFPAHPDLVDDAMVARYTEMSRAPGHRDVLLQLMSPNARTYATPERLAALSAPVLILHGARDALIPPENAQKFKDAIPQSELLIFEGIGHAPQEEIPEDSALAVHEFLYRLIERPALAAE